MGASIGQIVRMMSVEFLKLVLLAFVLAVPLAWYVMRQWLEGFAYRIDIDASVFAYAGIMAVAIALLTVSYQSVRAASSNPVVALRNE
jgi:putative ABC transport system permease protein